MRKGGYLPKNCIAVDKEEYEELKREAELYRMYRKQSKVTTNGVFLAKAEYDELVEKASNFDRICAVRSLCSTEIE